MLSKMSLKFFIRSRVFVRSAEMSSMSALFITLVRVSSQENSECAWIVTLVELSNRVVIRMPPDCCAKTLSDK